MSRFVQIASIRTCDASPIDAKCEFGAPMPGHRQRGSFFASVVGLCFVSDGRALILDEAPAAAPRGAVRLRLHFEGRGRTPRPREQTVRKTDT